MAFSTALTLKCEPPQATTLRRLLSLFHKDSSETTNEYHTCDDARKRA